MAARRTERRGKPPGPPLVAVDTSCVIALVCGWHEHHAATASLLEHRLDAGAVLGLPAPALIESYSVLTRLPAPHRLAPADALQLLDDNFRPPARTIALPASAYWSLVRGAPAMGVHGGHTYDAVIAACARAAGAAEIVTLNLKHFERFGDDTMKVTSPLGAAHTQAG